jgi:hypothetical protein
VGRVNIQRVLVFLGLLLVWRVIQVNMQAQPVLVHASPAMLVNMPAPQVNPVVNLVIWVNFQCLLVLWTQ